MKVLKLSFFVAFMLLAMSISAQDTVKKQTTKTQISGEDLLGLKSGADPKKANRGKAGVSRKKGRPVVFIIGDSTVKNGKDDGSNNQWGWGHFFSDMVDTTKVSVENHALGGRSSRTYITEGLWDNVLSAVKPGDYVLVQFGHNDSGSLNVGRARASLKGNGDNDTTVVMESTGKAEKVQSFGWYMRKYAKDVKAKKATPILLSHIPRNMFTTKDSVAVIRNSDGFGLWTKQAAAMEHVPYIDLNKLAADKLDKMGKDAIQKLYYGDHTHTSKAGAILNAQTVAEGLRSLKNCKLKNALKK
ncbi:rhamnogalacturonan acetylesterase [uncultured Bacteroides sp.]|uniref:rhamnogalacturonan acetylesterase n=1 Tax=uncultured Bacteroides sp. TaxID=162156 RepID=UPI002AA66204|nr:rhamnogalacturonan acetylesterase [uncultured Bacteroides sp.]